MINLQDKILNIYIKLWNNYSRFQKQELIKNHTSEQDLKKNEFIFFFIIQIPPKKTTIRKQTTTKKDTKKDTKKNIQETTTKDT